VSMDDAKGTVNIRLEFLAQWTDDYISRRDDSNLAAAWTPKVKILEEIDSYDDLNSRGSSYLDHGKDDAYWGVNRDSDASITKPNGNALPAFKGINSPNEGSFASHTVLKEMSAFVDVNADGLNMQYHWDRRYTLSQRGLWPMKWYPFDERTVRATAVLDGEGAPNVRFVAYKLLSPHRDYSDIDVSNIIGPSVSLAFDSATGYITQGKLHDPDQASRSKVGDGWLPVEESSDEYTLTTTYEAGVGATYTADTSTATGLHVDSHYACKDQNGSFKCGVPSITLSIKLKRDTQYVIMTKMIPVVLCVFCAYASLWAPVQAAMPRFAGSIIPFLTAMNIWTGLMSQLPTAALKCWLMMWIFYNMVLVCFLIAYTMVLLTINKRQGTSVVERCDFFSKIFCPIGFALSFPMATLGVNDLQAALWVLFSLFYVAWMATLSYLVQRDRIHSAQVHSQVHSQVDASPQAAVEAPSAAARQTGDQSSPLKNSNVAAVHPERLSTPAHDAVTPMKLPPLPAILSDQQ